MSLEFEIIELKKSIESLNNVLRNALYQHNNLPKQETEIKTEAEKCNKFLEVARDTAETNKSFIDIQQEVTDFAKDLIINKKVDRIKIKDIIHNIKKDSSISDLNLEELEELNKKLIELNETLIKN